MTRSSTLLAALALFFAASAPCGAEPAVTVKAVDLKQSPASDAKTVASVAANSAVDLVKREGAWVQLKAGADTGWAKLFDIKMGAAGSAPAAKGSATSSIAETLNLAAGKRDSSVTTGVRGLDEAMLAKAQPNEQQVATLATYAATPAAAQAFAKAGKLAPRNVAPLADGAQRPRRERPPDEVTRRRSIRAGRRCAAAAHRVRGNVPGGDLAQAALGGHSVAGIDLGKAVGVAKGASDAVRDSPGPRGDRDRPQRLRVAARRRAAHARRAAAGIREPRRDVARAQLRATGSALALRHHRNRDGERVRDARRERLRHARSARALQQRRRSSPACWRTRSHMSCKKHQLHDIQKNARKGVVLDLASLKAGGLTGDAARAVARVGLEGYVRGLSREDELEADRLGVVLAARSGYDPYGLVVVLQTLEANGSDATTAMFLKTHPSPSDRIAALEVEMPPSFERARRCRIPR